MEVVVQAAWLPWFLIACGGEPPPAPPAAVATPPAVAPLPPVAALGSVPVPADNPQTPEKISLGHQLFFDPRLSVDGSRSCYSCHRNEDGNGGHEPLAIGAGDKPLPRHSPVIWNVGYLPNFYWDGRSDSLEAQARAAWAGGNMGVGQEGLAAKAAEIAAIPAYAAQFTAVFGERGVTPDTIVQALAAYERTLVCDDTAFDRFQSGDRAALSARQQEGWQLFQGKAACVACHTPPHFSVAYSTAGTGFYNVGLGTRAAEPDAGRMVKSKQESDWGAFKVPTLRNVARSAPYFHDGSVADLTSAVRLMASGGVPNKNLSPILTDRGLSDDEIGAVVDFLGSLACGSLSEPKLP